MPRFDRKKLTSEIEAEKHAQELEEKNKEEAPARLNEMVISVLEELANEMGWNENREIIGPEYSTEDIKSGNGFVRLGTKYVSKWELKFTVAGKTYSLPVIDVRIDARYGSQISSKESFSEYGLIALVAEKAKEIMAEIENNKL